jgi:hypothetical protein
VLEDEALPLELDVDELELPEEEDAEEPPNGKLERSV